MLASATAFGSQPSYMVRLSFHRQELLSHPRGMTLPCLLQGEGRYGRKAWQERGEKHGACKALPHTNSGQRSETSLLDDISDSVGWRALRERVTPYLGFASSL